MDRIYKCTSRRCLTNSTIKQNCIIIVQDTDATPENCPYMCWSQIQYPKWKLIKSLSTFAEQKRHNNDFIKVCPQCYPQRNVTMAHKEGEYWICPVCSRCIEGKPVSKS